MTAGDLKITTLLTEKIQHTQRVKDAEAPGARSLQTRLGDMRWAGTPSYQTTYMMLTGQGRKNQSLFYCLESAGKFLRLSAETLQPRQVVVR